MLRFTIYASVVLYVGIAVGSMEINWARIAAQIPYYVAGALALGAPEREVAFAVPTGNFGNILAAWAARRMGLPVARLIVGSNRNDILYRLLKTGVMKMEGVAPTLSPSMIARRSGRILNVGSTAAFQPGPGFAVYCATKAYVLSFSEALEFELLGTGVTVTCGVPDVRPYYRRAWLQIVPLRIGGGTRLKVLKAENARL